MGEQPRLHAARNVHFHGGPAFRFHPLGHLLRKIDILQGDTHLACHGIEQVFVLARVGLFRKPLPKDQQADQSAFAPENGNQAFRRERGKVPCLVGNCGRDVPGFSAPGQVAKQGHRYRYCVQFSVKEACAKAKWELRPRQCCWNCVERLGPSSAFRNEVSICVFEIARKRFGMQRSLYLKLKQSREFMPVCHRACFFRKVLQDHAGVVRASEKSPVNSLRPALHHGGRCPHQHNPKHSAQGHADVGAFREESGNRAGE